MTVNDRHPFRDPLLVNPLLLCRYWEFLVIPAEALQKFQCLTYDSFC